MDAAMDEVALRAALSTGWRDLAADPVAAGRQAEAVLAGQPGSADAKLLLGAALRRQNDIAGAYAVLLPLMEPSPGSAIAWFEFGMVLHAMGNDVRAAEALRQATRLEHGFTAAWRNLGDVLLIQGHGPNADVAYAQAARAGAPAHLAQAAMALGANQPLEAERLLLDQLRQTPGDLRALHLLGEAALRVGRLVQAEAAFAECIAKAPKFADARHSLAVLFYVQRKFGQARPLFESLLAIAPATAALRILVTACMAETGDYLATLPHYDSLLSAWPDQASLVLLYAHALKTIGREREAAVQYRRCIALAPDWNSGAYHSLANIKTLPLTDDEVSAMERQLRIPSLGPDDAARLHYALGHAAEQRHDYTAAFGHFANGARLRRGAVSYDPDALSAYVEAAKQVFTAAFFAAREGSGCPSAAPIFVVGMPRAGSTLVEQILASHSLIEGAGELTEIGDIVKLLRGGQKPAVLPAIVASLDAPTLARLGERYLENTAQFRRLGRPHFVDKMPDNFLHAGLIRLILPNARIIDVRRTPMAAGLAAFRQFFQPQQTGADYTYDLTEIGRYTRDYTALMTHFDAVLPGHVRRIRYEDMVQAPEQEIRSLLSYCGVTFEEACLRFWETPRSVQTPSAQQVRQPIYRDGLDHWRRYTPFLAPLRAALGPLADGEVAQSAG